MIRSKLQRIVLVLHRVVLARYHQGTTSSDNGAVRLFKFVRPRNFNFYVNSLSS